MLAHADRLPVQQHGKLDEAVSQQMVAESGGKHGGLP
jgi:hypothetical protein